MSSSDNQNKTGKVIIHRKDTHSMRSLVYLFFLMKSFLYALLFFFWFILVDVFGWDIVIASSILGLLAGLIDTIWSKGSMVESLCFDYDNQKVVVGRTNMRNQQSETAIPFGSFRFRLIPDNFWNDWLEIYQGYEKKAVQIFDCLGWKKDHRKRIEQELENFREGHMLH